MSRRKAVLLILFEVLLAGWLCCLPKDLFKGTPYATVVLDRGGELLGARIADDGQWRFPPCDTVPPRSSSSRTGISAGIPVWIQSPSEGP